VVLIITNCHLVVDRLGPASIFDILRPHIAPNAAYNSREREKEHASICQEGTRTEIIGNISGWARGDPGHPVCWLEGPAGSGKSTIAHTIAQEYDDKSWLAFSFFFSRGKADRNDTAKFVPTFAYQLAESLPVAEPYIRRALTNVSSTANLRLRDQIRKLIVGPILQIQHIPSMVIVIDGLDECGDDDGLQELIRLLVDVTDHIPFRLLFTSRPETHIQQIFEATSTSRKTYRLSLRDFHSYGDIRKYLERHLSDIREQNDSLMRDVPRPWPSPPALDVLVRQSEGLFIYVSTLVKFVADKKRLPHEKLQAAMKIHKGVDPLYDQVLSEARQYDYFAQVVGTITYLRYPIALNELGQLLQLSSGCIRLGLRGCQSLFIIPDTDQESVRTYHASLGDFLRDHNRAMSHFMDPQEFHISILVHCLQLIGRNENYPEDDSHLYYACQNWCHHFSCALSHQTPIDVINAQCGDLVTKMEQQWLRIWMYGLEDSDALETVCYNCNSIVEVSCIYYHDVKLKKLNHITNQNPAIHMQAIQGTMSNILEVLQVINYAELKFQYSYLFHSA
jgi:NACHT domain